MEKLKNFIKKYFADFAFFYRYLRGKIFIAFFLSVGVSFLDGLGLTMFFPLLQVVDGSGDVDPDKMGKLAFVVEGLQKLHIPLTLFGVLAVMITFFVLKGLAVYGQSIYKIIIQQEFIRDIRLNLLRLLNRIDFKKFILSDVGRIQNTMTGEVSRVQRAFSAYMRTFEQGVMVVVYIGFAFMASPQFALLVSVGGLLTNFLYRFIYTRTKNASRKLTRYNSVFQGQIIQHVAYFKYLKATGEVENYGNKLEETIYKLEDSRRRIGFLNAIALAAREPMLVAVIALVIFVQARYFGGEIGLILISLAFFYRGLTSLMSLQQNWNSFMQVSGSLENMQEFQTKLEGSKEKKGKIKFKTFHKEIRLEEVNFAYGDEVILKDINLTIPKNTSVAFVGESGSGKTTLVNMITGLLRESEGEIFIDGKLLRDLRKETYQQRIGYVSQDPVIFNDTIYNNITFWAPKTKDNIQRFEESVKQSSLNEFLEELPKHGETQLGNNGINLSGGQKQRISIARELFKEIDILILDEATSALDSETEKAIQESIDALQGQYTILMVAHRLSTIKNADNIVLMDKGEIVDMDNFDRLVEKQDRFRKMVELQEL